MNDGYPSNSQLSAGQILARLTASATLAAGALLYGAGSATLSTLALGTAGRVLVAGASAPAWSDSGLSYASGVLAIAGSVPGTPSAGQVLIGGGALSAGGVLTAADIGAGTTPAGTYGSGTIWGKLVSVGGQFNVHSTVASNYELVHRGGYGFDWYTGSGGVLGLSLVNGTLATGYLHVKHTLAATSTTAAALRVDGGLGVGGAGYFGAGLYCTTLSASGTIATTVADATSGFKIQRATDDSQMLFGYSGGQFRIAATYGTTGAYKDVTIYTGDVERLTASAAGVINIYGTTPGTPGSTEVRIGNGQIAAGGNILHGALPTESMYSGSADVIGITAAAGNTAEVRLKSDMSSCSLFCAGATNTTWGLLGAAADDFQIWTNSTLRLTIASGGVATFTSKIGANGAAASSTMTGAVLADLITWLQSFIA